MPELSLSPTRPSAAGATVAVAPSDDRRMRSGAELMTLLGRALRLSLRNVDGLSTALALPVILMVMFVELFGGAIHTGTRYVDYVVPGVLTVCVGFGAGTTAVTVAEDLRGSIIDRLRAMDVRASALIAGHVLASVARNLLSCALALGVACALGFRPSASAGQWLAAAGILLLYVLAMSWLAAAIGVAVRSPEGAQGITFLIGFLPYPSSAFVPVATMPAWLHGFAAAQPVSQVADALRRLLTGAPAGPAAWHAMLWSGAIAAGAIMLAGRLFSARVR